MKKKLKYGQYKKLKEKYENKVSLIASIRLVVFIVMIFSFILKYYYYEMFFSCLFVLMLISFVVLIIVHDRYYKVFDYYNKYLEIIEEYIKRSNGEWKSFSDNGGEYLNDSNVYLGDLDVLGEGSLFQLLNVARSRGGKDRLVDRLSNREISNLEMEQEAIEELCNNINFCIDYQVNLYDYRDVEVNLGSSLKEVVKGGRIKKVDFGLGIFLSFINVLFLILGLFGVVDISLFSLVFMFSFLINYFYSYVYRKEFERIDKVVNIYSELYGVFNSVLTREFSSCKLVGIKDNIRDNYGVIRRLEKFDVIKNIRNNLIGNFIFNGMFSLNIFVVYYFSLFIRDNVGKLTMNVLDVEEMEVMISLAGLGIIKDNVVMPKKCDDISISFDNVHHPLLEEKLCVTNSFSTKNGVNIITGSNMGGKTSFLRTIGINVILMNAGGYVCASKFSSNYFRIFTSMRIRDDIKKGISTFYGELLRIKEVTDYIGSGNMLVLIDEIFKGTNYQDRIYGALEVIKKLNSDNIITFLTTHDFELCDIDNVRNYHVKEYYHDDRICFDYKIREGKVESTNAKYLMKKLNIID